MRCQCPRGLAGNCGDEFLPVIAPQGFYSERQKRPAVTEKQKQAARTFKKISPMLLAFLL